MLNLLGKTSPAVTSALRVDQEPGQIVLRFPAGETAWELVLPDHEAERAEVRVCLREIGSRRRAEASALLPWSDYRSAREWLRCLPDGRMTLADAEPALTVMRTAFGPMLSALGARD